MFRFSVNEIFKHISQIAIKFSAFICSLLQTTVFGFRLYTLMARLDILQFYTLHLDLFLFFTDVGCSCACFQVYDLRIAQFQQYEPRLPTYICILSLSGYKLKAVESKAQLLI